MPQVGFGGVVTGVDLPTFAGSAFSFRPTNNDFQPAPPPIIARNEPPAPYPGWVQVYSGFTSPQRIGLLSQIIVSDPLPSFPGFVFSPQPPFSAASAPAIPSQTSAVVSTLQSIYPGSVTYFNVYDQYRQLPTIVLAVEQPRPLVTGWVSWSTQQATQIVPPQPVLISSPPPPMFPGWVQSAVTLFIQLPPRPESIIVRSEPLNQPGSVLSLAGAAQLVAITRNVLAYADQLPAFPGVVIAPSSPNIQPPSPIRYPIIYSDPLNQPGWAFYFAGPLLTPLSPPLPPIGAGMLTACLTVDLQAVAYFSVGAQWPDDDDDGDDF